MGLVQDSEGPLGGTWVGDNLFLLRGIAYLCSRLEDTYHILQHRLDYDSKNIHRSKYVISDYESVAALQNKETVHTASDNDNQR